MEVDPPTETWRSKHIQVQIREWAPPEEEAGDLKEKSFHRKVLLYLTELDFNISPFRRLYTEEASRLSVQKAGTSWTSEQIQQEVILKTATLA